jgi:hypothetical protein
MRFLIGFLFPLSIIICVELSLNLSHQTKIEIAKAHNAVPAVGAQYLLARNFPSDLIPLGGISKRGTYLCDEGLGKIFYKSDRFGFPNPDQQWDREITDIAFIGDSYFQGACISEKISFINRLRKPYSIINLPSFGHGPLAQLGLIKEYLAEKKPKIVIMSYVANDLYIDLSLEHSNKTLSQYLKPTFRQNLIKRQNDIDQLYFTFLKGFTGPKNPTKNFHISNLWRKLSLKYINETPSGTGFPTDYQYSSQLRYDLYERIIKEAQRTIQSWGGKLIILKIPDAFSFNPVNKDIIHKHQKRMSTIFNTLNIDYIDLHQLLKQDKNPYHFYTPLSGHYGHFNQQGHDRVFMHLKRILRNKYF